MPLTITDKTDIKLPCPLCGGTNGVMIYTNMLESADTDLFSCGGCDGSFGIDHVNELVAGAARWEAIVRWIDTVPVLEE